MHVPGSPPPRPGRPGPVAASWDRLLDVRGSLRAARGDTSDLGCARAASAVGGVLRAAIPACLLDWDDVRLDREIAALVEEFETLRHDSYAGGSGCTPALDLEDMVERLHTWAERYRVRLLA